MFKTSFLLRNRHIQTLYAPLFRKQAIPKVAIETFELVDGDFLECYWHKEKPKDERPIVILFHGLAGSVNSPYIKGIMKALEKQGLYSVLMHFRGCGKNENRLARSYHSGDTADAKAWIDYVHKKYPNNPLYAIGYSIGGNVLLKLLGEEQTPLKQAIAISVPMDLAVTAEVINQGFSKVYEHYLLKALKHSLLKKYEKFDIEKLTKQSKETALNLKSIQEFDEVYTAPIHGFNSANNYYAKSSSKQYLINIKIPTLIIHANDDPFMDERVVPKEEELSSFVKLEFSQHGGHVGFVAGTIFKPKYWLEERIVNYFSELR